MGFGIDVLVDGADGSLEGCFVDRFFEFDLGRLHQGRVECTAYGQTQCAFGARFLEFGTGGIDRFDAARDDQLAGAVVVGRHDHAVDRGAGFLHFGVVESQDRRHRTGYGFAGFLHGHRTFGNEPQTVFERKSAGHHQG